MIMDAINHEPCEKCGHNRWKTISKDMTYECRKCGNVRMS